MEKKIIDLKDCFKAFTVDQDKAIKPEDTLKRFYKQVEALDINILHEVKRIDTGRLDIPVYFSICGDDAQNLTGTKKQMGKGASPIQAEASACMELAERFSFFSYKNNPDNFIVGDYEAMEFAGYPVLDIELLLESVHDVETDVSSVKKLLKDIPMQWTWAKNITTDVEVLIPFSWFYAINEFNGPSAGNTYEEAVLQGICEVVERHVCSLVNRYKLDTPQIDLDSVSDPVACELIKKFRDNNIELYANDFTLDTGVCTIGALAIDRSTFPEKSEIVYTAGTTPDPEKALIRAITEVAQLAGDFDTDSNYIASGLPKPLSMEEVSYLTESSDKISINEITDLSDNNIKIEVDNCIKALQEIGMEILVVDATHSTLDIPALYTIIPGAHFRERSMIENVGLFAAKLAVELIADPEQLEAKFSQLEEILPSAYFLEFYRGRNLYTMGLAEEALPYFEKALALNPEKEDLPYIYSYKGHCLQMLEKYDLAIEALELGRVEDDERPDLHNMLGVCYFKKEQFEDAIKHFERAVALNPASGMDYANLGVNHSRLGNKEEAIQYFTIALTLDPSLDFVKEQLASLTV